MESFVGRGSTYIIRRDSVFFASFLFGRKPRSASDCYGIGTTKVLKNYFVQEHVWDELILMALNNLRALNEISQKVCKMAHFLFGDLFNEISVFKVKERLSNVDLFRLSQDSSVSTSLKNGQRAVLSTFSHFFLKSKNLSSIYVMFQMLFYDSKFKHQELENLS
jgi:hypothetical protein